MAELPSGVYDFDNREEDWPDPDVDSGEEGAEIMRRSEAALFASMDRDMQKKKRAIEATYGGIPQSLYDKAQDHQDQLTEAERQLLLGRGDVVGKALAYPDSLTTDELHQALRWPPPDTVRASIQRVTGGVLSTPKDLYTKASNALDHDQFETLISDAEATLICANFHNQEDAISIMMATYGIPGYAQASKLLSCRLGLDFVVWKAAATRYSDILTRRNAGGLPSFPPPGSSSTPLPTPQPLLPAITAPSVSQPVPTRAPGQFLATMTPLSLPDFFQGAGSPIAGPNGRAPSPTLDDDIGAGPWPAFFPERGAVDLFQKDTGIWGYNVTPAWAALPEAEKESYRVRAEARRREAWVYFEKILIRRAEGGPPLPPVPKGWEENEPPSPPPELVRKFFPNGFPEPVVETSAFEVFRDEAGMGEYWEALARWEALTRDERMVYSNRASKANQDAELERRRARAGQSAAGAQ